MAINIRCSCGSDSKLTAKICSGCGLKFPKKKKYKVVVRANGKRVTRTVSNLDLAREIESKLKIDIARGDFNLSRKKIPTLEDVWKRFEPWATENIKSWKDDKGRYTRHLQPTLGRKDLDKISPLDIERIILQMKKGRNSKGKIYSPQTIKHVVLLLSRLYNRARHWKLYDGNNPCQHVKTPRVNNQVTEYLTPDELSRLLSTLEKWPNRMSAAIILFLLHTGLRRGEIFKLKWENVDLANGIFKLIDPKGGKDTILPLSKKALGILQALPRDEESEWIFYGREGQQRTDFKGPWLRVKKAAELPSSFRLHGLRHHFASSLVSAGTDLYTVSRLLTHKDISTTQRYAHLSDQTLRDAVNLSDNLQTAKPTKIINLEQHNG